MLRNICQEDVRFIWVWEYQCYAICQCCFNYIKRHLICGICRGFDSVTKVCNELPVIGG